MHTVDQVVTEYHKLLTEQKDVERQLKQLQPLIDRKAKIEADLEALRPKLASP